MYRITLIKTCSDIQIAHCYEHLYYDALTAFFKKAGLLSYLDYHILARTYEEGFIYFAITFFTPTDATKHAQSLDISISEEALGNVLLQVMAEKGHRLISASSPRVLKEKIMALHLQPWHDLDGFGVFAGSKPRQKRQGLRVSPQAIRLKNLHVHVILSPTFARVHKDALPLFSVVARALQDNIMNELLARFPYHFTHEVPVYKLGIARESYYFQAWGKQYPFLTNELKACKELVCHMLQASLIGRIHTFLVSSTYHTPMSAPDENGIIDSMGTLVGAEGWRTVGTLQNIHSVLEHSSLQLQYGAQKQDINISALLSA